MACQRDLLSGPRCRSRVILDAEAVGTNSPAGGCGVSSLVYSTVDRAVGEGGWRGSCPQK